MEFYKYVSFTTISERPFTQKGISFELFPLLSGCLKQSTSCPDLLEAETLTYTKYNGLIKGVKGTQTSVTSNKGNRGHH